MTGEGFFAATGNMIKSVIKRAGIVALSMASIMTIVLPGTLNAAEPVHAPQLRIETGMHTTMIRRVLPDLPRNRLITCSDDKTIRVWQMPEMRLVSVLRVPLDAGHEGRLYAVAVSPDGRTVAAAGWTGWDWDKKACIYFFDLQSGELVRRLGVFDNVINALAWLPDGGHLVVGLQGYSGLRVLRLKDGSVAAADTQCQDDLMDMDVSRRGRIVTAALDGYIRLYDRNFKLIGRRAVPGGKKPVSVRFSPGAEEIAIGFVDVPAIAVAAAQDLNLKYLVNTKNLPGQTGFTTVVWSSDGTALYGSGEHRGPGLNPVYRWKDQGRAAPEKISYTLNRIVELQQMPDNHIAFASEDPGVGVFSPDGKVKLFRGPDIANFSRARKIFAMTADASVVRYPLDIENRVVHTFSVFGGGDQNTAAPLPRGEKLHGPLQQSKRIRVADWDDSFNPKINGKKPVLDEYERSRCFAFTPDGSAVLLGTEWALRMLRPDASEVWSVKLPAVVWSVNISRNGLLAAAALSDGTIRWYRAQDGREVLAYFPLKNGTDWIAWVPEGYYMSSIYGDNYIGWHVNRGKDLTPDFYRAVQFDRILYRPDVITAAFRAALKPATRSLEAPGSDFHIGRLGEIAPPRLRLKLLGFKETAEGTFRLNMELKGEKNALPIKDYTLFVNNIPVTPARERKIEGRECERFRRELEIDLHEQSNEIRVEAFNGVAMGVAETYVGLPVRQKPRPVKGNLYMLAVGVNVFPALPGSTHLAYAANDAQELGRAWKTRGGGNYGHTLVHVISDGSADKPDKATILKALTFADQAGPDDTVVIFLASHGLSDPNGNYYFVPRDARPEDIESAKKGGKAESLIAWTAFFDALRGTAGHRVLIVDTCQARSIEGKFQPHSLMKRSASSQFAIIVASKGNEESQEYAPAKHGLFTYALLRSLNRDADANRDGIVTLKEAFDFSLPIVEKLRHRQAGPQTPQMVSPQVLSEMPILR